MAKRPRRGDPADATPEPATNEEYTTMPSDNTTAETDGLNQVRVQGLLFNAPVRFHEGHVLTAIEASVLQQTFQENLRNNFAAAVKKAVEALQTEATAAGDPGVKDASHLTPDVVAELAAKFSEYAASYTFNAPRGPGAGGGLTPLEREAQKVAMSIVLAQAAKKGLKLSAEDKKRLAAEYAQKPAVIDEAKRRVEATMGGLAGLLDDAA